MKKLFALLLAAMMMFASVSVLAEGTEAGTDAGTDATADTAADTKKESPKTDDNPTVEQEEEIFTVVPLGPVGEEYKAKIIKADEDGEPVIGVFTPEVQEALKAIVGENGVIDEMFGLEAPGWDPSMGAQYLVLEFATEYKAGEPVSAVLGLVFGEGEDVRVDEHVLTAEIPEDYKVKVYLPIEMLNDLVAADEAFVVIVSTDAEAAA